VAAALLVTVVAGGYIYANLKFDAIKKVTVANEVQPISGQPFNIMLLGSDSRAGLSGTVAAATGATTGSVSGARSDVIKVIHIDPNAGTISLFSVPRDTMVAMLGSNKALLGSYSKVNAAFNGGASMVAQTLTDTFGIPINYTVIVSFSGLMNVADAVHGVYMNFPYKLRDGESQLDITHTGCQLISGFQALALTRARHLWYSTKGAAWPVNGFKSWFSDAQLNALGWYYDGNSDFGRIQRQNEFMRALVNRIKGTYNPLTLNSVLSNLPQGISLDSKLTLNTLISIALRFHSISSANIQTYTLPVLGAVVDGADDEFVEEPQAQQLLVNVFGSQLQSPLTPPPASNLTPQVVPVITPTTTTTAAPTTVKHHKKGSTTTVAPTTTTTYNYETAINPWDPTPCTP
jgi:LCP family protein required for cell wall assembly